MNSKIITKYMNFMYQKDFVEEDLKIIYRNNIDKNYNIIEYIMIDDQKYLNNNLIIDGLTLLNEKFNLEISHFHKREYSIHNLINKHTNKIEYMGKIGLLDTIISYLDENNYLILEKEMDSYLNNYENQEINIDLN